MADFPPLAIPDIQRWVGEQSLDRGRPYFQQRALSNARRQGLTLKALCQGSRPEPYHVEVRLGPSGIVAASCSCPVGGGGRCKHVAALLLAWLDMPEDFVEMEDLDAVLGRLEKSELVALVRRMAQRSPDLEQLIEIEVPALRGTAASQPVEAQSIRRQLRHAFELAWSRWGSTSAVGEDARQYLDRAEVYLAQGNARNAATIYTEVARCILDHAFEPAHEEEDYEDYYDRDYYAEEDEGFDEDGELGILVDQCVEGLRRCLMALSAPEEREGVLEALFDIYQWSITHEGSATGSEVPSVIMEQATPEERRHVAALVRDALPGGQGWDADYRRRKHAPFLLELEQDQLDDEAYLRICRETGLLQEFVDRLLTLGRVDEAAAEARKLDEMKLLSLADTFIGRAQATLIEGLVRERARTSQGPVLIEWLKRRAKEAGNLEDALALSVTLFWRYPSLAGYNELKELAQALDRWDALRATTLTKLAQQKQHAVLTQIHLAEGEIDRALESLEQMKTAPGFWYGGGTLEIQVAHAAEESRPEAAIRLYMQQVEALIQHQGRENYATAAGYLKRVRDLYRRLGQGQQWQTLVADLREKQRRLRALQDELQKAGLFEPEPSPQAPKQTEAPKPAEKSAVPTVHLLRSPDSPPGL